MLDITNTYAGSILTAPLASSAGPGEVLDALARQPGAIWLESSATHDRWGRHIIAACRPVHVLTLRDDVCRQCDADGRIVPWTADRPVVAPTTGGNGSPARALAPTVERHVVPLHPQQGLQTLLRQVLRCVRAEVPQGCTYGPGWMGYLGYGLGRHFERLPGHARRDTGEADMHLAFYDAVLVYDNLSGAWQLASLRFDDPPPGAGRAERELLAVLRQAEEADEPLVQVAPTGAVADCFSDPQLTSNFSPDRYRRTVAKCVDYIAAGDIFQVNLSQRFTRPTTAEPLEIYRQLRRFNPAWYSGYIAGEGWAVLSSSPELFLRYRDGQVITRPIKGTRRRFSDPAADRRAGEELLASEKDNAELAMIIDLLRNDLGRVCRYGSVRVAQRRQLEAHPTVLHLVGTVTGELHDRHDVADLIRATFPGGSITGAPKIRAMEIIDEMEGLARGVYTGSIAHFGTDGSAELSIVIRTAVWDRGRVHVHVGGGIVADSTPDGEYVETLDKARAVLAAVAAAERP